MKIAGIIAEYDPFHNGHKAHIDATRQQGSATHVVTVVSGSFTQRGEPALCTKFQRSEMALRGGADLVLELPLPWAMASAEQFATGGVATLQGLGCVDMLSFGSECGDVTLLQEMASLTETDAYRQAFLKALNTGMPYAAARQAAAEQLVGDKATTFADPNNTLALEYIRATKRLDADFDFFTLQRQGAGHDDSPTGNYASAGWIRRQIRAGQTDVTTTFVPAPTSAVLADALTAGQIAILPEKLDGAILARLRSMTTADFAALPYVSEGLENRLWQAAQTATSTEEWLMAVKTKRYPLSRLRRVMWAALLGMDNRYTGQRPPYIRVLGMNERGREILAAAQPTLPLLTRVAQLEDMDDICKAVFELDCRGTDLQSLTMVHPLPCSTDKKNKFIRI